MLKLSRYYSAKHRLTLPLYYSINYQQPTIHTSYMKHSQQFPMCIWGGRGGRGEEGGTLYQWISLLGKKSNPHSRVGGTYCWWFTNDKVRDNPSPSALPMGKAHSQVRNFPKIQIQWLGTPTMATSYPPYFGNTPTCWLPDYSVCSMSLDIFVVGEVPYEYIGEDDRTAEFFSFDKFCCF